jgi:murein DD-endopeptidase MepM/ murein hydrolase activator NlpD
LILLLSAGLFVFLLLAPREPEGPAAIAVFPLPGAYRDAYSDDWGAERAGGAAHEGTDLYAPEGTPIYSITSGTVVSTFGPGNWNNLGGHAVSIRADRSVGRIERGDALYYAHMNAPTTLERGDRVEAGEKIGEVGDTGGGPSGTRGRFVPHLHLGWYDGSLFGSSRAETESGAMNPYPLLREIG